MSNRKGISTLVIATALLLFAGPTVARADVGTFSNTTTIQIPAIGQASPILRHRGHAAWPGPSVTSMPRWST